MIANNYIVLYESRINDLHNTSNNADLEFGMTANVDEIVGYYLTNYEDQALNAWLENTKDINLTDQDKEVTTLLYILS